MRLVARIDIQGMPPVPWKVPDVGVTTTKAGKRQRFAKKDKRLAAWQQYVRLHAADAMVGKSVTTEPLFVKLEFVRHTPKAELHGCVWTQDVEWSEDAGCYVKKGESTPDVDNLSKAAVDALQDVVFGNDVQVCVKSESRRYGPYDGVRVSVWAIEPGDELAG